MRLYQQGHYHTAEQTLRIALHEAEQFGPTDTRVAVVLNNLASLCHNQRKLTEAETLYLRALAIRSEAYGPDHRMVAQSLNNLASLYRELGNYAYDQDPARPGWAPLVPNDRWADPSDDREPFVRG